MIDIECIDLMHFAENNKTNINYTNSKLIFFPLQTNSTPGIISKNIVFKKNKIYKILINITKNDNTKAFFYINNNHNLHTKKYLCNGDNNIILTVNNNIYNIGILISDPKLTDRIELNSFKVNIIQNIPKNSEIINDNNLIINTKKKNQVDKKIISDTVNTPLLIKKINENNILSEINNNTNIPLLINDIVKINDYEPDKYKFYLLKNNIDIDIDKLISSINFVTDIFNNIFLIDSLPEKYNSYLNIDNVLRNLNNQNDSLLNTMFDKIYLLILERDYHKKEYIDQYMKKYNIEFEYFNGVDGYIDPETNKIYTDYLKKNFDDPTIDPIEKISKKRLIKSLGAVGYLQSTLNILLDAKKNNYKKILIFDDDVFFNKNLDKYLIEIIKEIPNFKLLYFGSSQHVLPNNIIIQNRGILKYIKSPIKTDGSFAVGYDHTIYDILIKEIEKYNAPYDSGPLRHIISLYPNECYTIYPNIIIPDTTTSKVINIERELRTYCMNVNWDLTNMDFTRSFWKVSIIIANYNSERYIRYTIESVIKQTYKNIELIIVDDVSTDNCIDIIKEYIKKYDWIKLYIMKKNSGAYTCRNKALDIATGMFIKMLDSDDILLSRAVEIDIENYMKNPDYEIFFSNIYRSNTTIYTNINDNLILNLIFNERINYIEKNNNCNFGQNFSWKYKFRFGLPTIFVHKSFFTKYGKWNDKYRYGMDLEIIQRYIVLKYKKLINYNKLWKLICDYKADKYSIYLSKTMNYVSYPMNENNATIKCKNKERFLIHEHCENKLNNLLNTL